MCFRNLTVNGNGNNGVGGGLINYTGDVTLTNCLFFNNTASSSGGALAAESGTLSLISCTLANNIAQVRKGGGIHSASANISVVNTNFFNNSGENGNINAGASGTATVSYFSFYNITSGNNGDITPNVIDGGNNITNTDPLFSDAVNNDYSLKNTSSSINAGDNAANTLTKDLAGKSRIIDVNLDNTSTIDIGAFERIPIPFTDINVALTAVDFSSVLWGDYDNDGDLDILLTGSIVSEEISKIYRNDAGNFTDIDAGLAAVYSSSVAWGDYDNDGELDILLIGYTTSGRTSKIYKNENGVFTDIDAGLPGCDDSSVTWGDYDNDGDLDILLTGRTGSGNIAKIYRNHYGIFTDINAGLENVYLSSVAWGDYDNDGDLDILLTGYNSGRVSKIYTNNNGAFTELSTVSLAKVSDSSVAWGDYDNDGDLDILLTGSLSGGRVSKIYRNNTVVANTPPIAPTNLSAIVNNGNTTVALNWDAATNDETPANGLSYNVYIKEVSASTEYVKSPMALESDGWRKLPAIGNAMQNTAYTYKIPTIYSGIVNFEFKLQAIDHNFAGSAFSTTGDFSVDLTNPQNVLYVDAKATSGLNNGSNWANSYTSLQTALQSTGSFTDEIWVVAGTYKSGIDQNDSFIIPNGISILGGFNATETTADERNWATNPTVLSGDLNNSSTANIGDSHTIIKLLNNNNITLDGLILENAFADDASSTIKRTGAGIYASNATGININNCIFRNLIADGNGSNGVGGGLSSFININLLALNNANKNKFFILFLRSYHRLAT